MDDDTRKAFAALSATLAEIDVGVRGTRAELVQARREVHSVRTEVLEVSARTGVLETHVFGSKPPPAPPTSPLIKRTTGAELEVDALTGRLMAVESGLVETKVIATEARAAAEATRSLNEKQSKAMGLPTEEEPSRADSFFAFIKSRKGKEVFIQLAILVFSTIAAIKGATTEARIERAPVVVQDGGN